MLDEIFLRYGIEAISAEVFRLQERMLKLIDNDAFRSLVFRSQHRSGILSLATAKDPVMLANELREWGVVAAVSTQFQAKEHKYGRYVLAKDPRQMPLWEYSF